MNSGADGTISWCCRRFHLCTHLAGGISSVLVECGGEMKLTIKKWRAVAFWKWTVDEEVCGICQQPFNACCTDCKEPGDSCPPRTRSNFCACGVVCCFGLRTQFSRFPVGSCSRGSHSDSLVSFFCAVWGRCKHVLHLHCIEKWLVQPSSKNQCPMCRQEWTPAAG